MNPKFFVGLDISKLTIDVALLRGRELLCRYKIRNTPEGIYGLLRDIKTDHGCTRRNTLYCAEDMGIYSTFLRQCIARQRMQICMESALQISRSLGIKRGKNDALDAERIAHYLEKNHHTLRYWVSPRECILKLKELNTVRMRLVKVRAMLTSIDKLNAYYFDEHHKKWVDLLTAETTTGLNGDIAAIDHAMGEIIAEDERLSELDRIMQSFPCIGEVISRNIIIYTNEFKNFPNARKFASYCGIAPFAWLSGESIVGRPRVSHLANKELKRLLHLSAIGYTRLGHTPLGRYYIRKVEEGKNKMSVLNAIRNKLVQRVFACVQQGCMYDAHR